MKTIRNRAFKLGLVGAVFVAIGAAESPCTFAQIVCCQPMCCQPVYWVCQPVCCVPCVPYCGVLSGAVAGCASCQQMPQVSQGTESKSGGNVGHEASPVPALAPQQPSKPENPTPGAIPPPPAKGSSIGVPASNLSMNVHAVPSDKAGVASFVVSVPEDAKVFINGKPTKSTGARRKYYSGWLKNGATYTFDVVAQVYRNGERLENSEKLVLGSGDARTVTLSLPRANSTQVASLSTP
jgi:uncharacterized protein (TIGR03000 family)